MSKRPRADSHSEAINSVFEILFASANPYTDNVSIQDLKKLKHRLLSEPEAKSIRKAAKEFTLDEAVQDFGLTYSRKVKETKYRWQIEALPDVQTFQPSACFGKVSP